MALRDPVNADNTLSLSDILAEELLPDWLAEYQLVIALHMLELKKHLPKAYVDEFETELKWLNQFIEARYNQEESSTLLTLSQGYKVVVKQKQLKDKPLPGFVCCELNTLGSQRTLFLQYKSLVLLCAIRLFLLTPVKSIETLIEKGHSLLASCVKNATNEVRWITLNRRPNTLDNLPDPDLFDLLGLFGKIDEYRNQVGTPEAIKTSLSKYHTIFSNAYHESPGKRKTRASFERSANKSQLQELEVTAGQDEVTVTEIRTSIEKTKNIAQWQREEDLSSPPNAARYTVAINEQTTKNNQLNAILAHRYADQLKVRQQSAPCDYQGLTEFEVHEFVQHCINVCQSNTNMVAETLFCALAFGKSITQLSVLTADATAAEKIWLTDNQIKYQLFHKLPSSVLSKDKDFLLPDVEHSLIIDCPRLNSKSRWLVTEDDSQHKTFIRNFNRAKDTRLTLGRIARYKREWLAQHGVDETVIALLHNSPLSANSGLSYSRFKVAELQATHLRFIDHILGQSAQSFELPTSSPLIGTRLAMNEQVLKDGLAHLDANIHNLCKLSIYHPLLHAEYTTYVHYVLALATGYRPVNGIFGTIDDFDLVTGTIWISDKESRQGIAARILYLPQQAIEQVEYYLNYLRVLRDRYRYEDPELAHRTQQALDGTGSLLFGRYSNAEDYQTAYQDNNDLRREFTVRQAHDYSTEVIEISPKYISEQTDRILPLPNNWNRHYMRNKLIEFGVR